MKSILFALVFLFTATIFSQETIPIETPYGTKEVIIPESKESLVKNYLTLSKMYFSQKYDLELLQGDIAILQKAITKTNALLLDITKKYDDLNEKVYKSLLVEYGILETKNIDLTKEYNEVIKKYNDLLVFKEPLQNYLFGIVGYQLNGIEVKAGYEMILFEKFMMGIYSGYPLSINLVFGIRF